MLSMKHVKKIHPKLEAALLDFVSNPELKTVSTYGYFCQYLDYIEDVSIGTAAVSFRNNKPVFIYNPLFLDALTHKEMMFLIVHEVKHLFSNHVSRLSFEGCVVKTMNIAQDMIINQQTIDDHTLNQHCTFIKGGYKMHPEYEGEWVAETLYKWLLENDPDLERTGAEDPDHDFDTGDGGLDHHFEMTEQERQLLQSAVEDIKQSMKNRGNYSSSFEKTMSDLAVQKNTYLKHLKQQMAIIKGGLSKDRTYRRRNRLGITGLKGSIKQGITINTILDTSGSMVNDIPQLLGTILKNGLEVTLIQVDTEVRSVTQISSKNDLRKTQLSGFGGTVLQPAINHMIENFNGKGAVVMTDGYTDKLDFTGFEGKVVLLYTDKVPLYVSNGKVVEVKFDPA